MAKATVVNRTEAGARAKVGGEDGGLASTIAGQAADVTWAGVREVERGVERIGDGFWKFLRRRPFVGVGLAAGVGLGAAVTFGATELAVGILAGYAAYQVLKKNMPPSKALRKALDLEKEIR
jgi:hypothetical protein